MSNLVLIIVFTLENGGQFSMKNHSSFQALSCDVTPNLSTCIIALVQQPFESRELTAACLGHQRLVSSTEYISCRSSWHWNERDSILPQHVCRIKSSAIVQHLKNVPLLRMIFFLKLDAFLFNDAVKGWKKRRTKMFSIYKRGNS
jgi:hypothetical protein